MADPNFYDESRVKGIRLLGGEATIEGLTVKEESPGSSIFSFKDIFSDSDVKQILDVFSSHSHFISDGVTNQGASIAKKSRDLLIPQVPTKACRQIDKLIFDRLSECTNAVSYLVPGYFSQGEIKDTGYQIQHYPPGGFYSWHYDFATRRKLAVIVYLNTVVTGGETEFWYQDVKIKPERGKVLVFPVGENYTHRGCDSTEDKYIITSFMVGVT